MLSIIDRLLLEIQLGNNNCGQATSAHASAFYNPVLKLELVHQFSLDSHENFRRVSQVFFLQKSVCRFLIGTSGEEWRWGKED